MKRRRSSHFLPLLRRAPQMSSNTSQPRIKVLDNVNLSDSEKDQIEEKMCMAVKASAPKIREHFGDDEEAWVVM